MRKMKLGYRFILVALLLCSQHSFSYDVIKDPLSQLKAVPASSAIPLLDANTAKSACSEAPKANYALFDVIENVLCHNPKTKVAWANVKAQAAQVGVAKAAYLPTLSASAQRINDHASNHIKGTLPLDSSSHRIYRNETLMFSWVLYDFGLRSANVDNAEKMLASAMAGQNNELQTVFVNAVKDYYAALVAQQNIQSTREIEASAKRVLEAATVRVKGGVAAVSDQLQAQTAYSQSVYNRSKAEGDWLSARGALATDMGLRPDSPIQLIESKNTPTLDAELIHSTDELLNTAQQIHPSLVAARAEVDAAKANERSVKAQGRPSISIVSRYNTNNQPQSVGLGEYVDANAHDRYVGLQIDIPLFEGFTRTYKIRSAEAQVEAKQANLSDIELQVAVNVWTHYQGLKISTEGIRSTQEILDNAQGAFKASESRYQKGVSSIIELISTQTTLANAQQQRIQALAEWQTARIQLAASIGNLELAAIH